MNINMLKQLISLLALTSLLTVILSNECNILTHTISIDTNGKEDNLYDAIISLTTKDECKIECNIIDNAEETIELKEEYNLDHRYYHTLIIKNLHLYKEYRYKCNVDSSDGYIKFPKTNDKANIAIINGSSISDRDKETINYLENNINNYDAILSLGVIGDGIEGNQYMDLITQISSKIPYMITSDVYEDDTVNESILKRFNMPNKEISKNLYYSFDINDAHIVSISSNYLIISEDNLDSFNSWIKEDLANTKKKWKIVFTNLPLHCTDLENNKCGDELDILKNILEEIFLIYKVDMVISKGNSYDYGLFPFFNQTINYDTSKDKKEFVNPKFPIYLVCGSAFDISKEDINKHAQNIIKQGVCQLNITNEEITAKYKSIKDDFIHEAYSVMKTSDNSSKSINDNNDTEKKSDTSKTESENKSEEDTEKKQNISIDDEENEEKDEDHEFKEEDELAFNAFYFIITLLSIFMIMFIYNLIKCYVRSPTEEIPEGLKNYSKELQNITAVEDDAVLDLSQAS